MSNQSFLTALLGRDIESKNLEHNCVGWDDGELVLEVVLVLIGPTVNVVRLNLDLERPVGLSYFVTKLVELGKLHDGHGTWEVCNFSQMLTNGLSGTIVVHLS